MVLKNYRTLATTQTWDSTAQTIITQLPRDFLGAFILPALTAVGATS